MIAFRSALVALSLIIGIANASADNRTAARKHYTRALAYINLGQHKEAIGEFQAAYVEAPLPSLLYNIAREHEALGADGDIGSLRSAVDFYKRYLAALKAAPDRAEVEKRVEGIEARIASAMAAARAPVAAAGPEHTQAERSTAGEHAEAASRLYKVGDYAKARDEFKAAYLAVPDATYLFQIGQCSRQIGDLEEALRAYRTYQREKPDAPNRSEVETYLWDLEEQLQQKAAVAAAAANPGAAPVAKAEAPSRKGLIAAVVAVVVVVIGVAVGVGIALTPRNAPDPMTSAGIVDLKF